MAATILTSKKTSDGKTVNLWSDGSLTGPFGQTIRGIRKSRDVSFAVQVGWRVLGEVALYLWEEVPLLVRAARGVEKKGGTPGDVRARFEALQKKAKRSKPVWETLCADRDGKPTERVWRFSRLSPWKKHAVWDFCGRKDRYEIFVEKSGAYVRTGLKFTTQAALLDWMADNPPRVETKNEG